MNLANVDSVLQEISEGPVGEGNAAVVLGDLGVPALRNDATPVQFSNKQIVIAYRSSWPW